MRCRTFSRLMFVVRPQKVSKTFRNAIFQVVERLAQLRHGRGYLLEARAVHLRPGLEDRRLAQGQMPHQQHETDGLDAVHLAFPVGPEAVIDHVRDLLDVKVRDDRPPCLDALAGLQLHTRDPAIGEEELLYRRVRSDDAAQVAQRLGQGIRQ